MASSTFVSNPAFRPALYAAVGAAMDDLLDEGVRDAQNEIRSTSSSAAAAVKKDPVRFDVEGPVSRVSMGGLGPILEHSKQRARTTRSGANRGVMKRHEFFHRHIQAAIDRGLSLGRFL